MKSYDIGRAIILLQPDAQFTLVGNKYDDVVWLEPLAVIPTLAEIEAEIALIPVREEQAKADKAAAKAAAEAKLAALGLTADDLKALGLA